MDIDSISVYFADELGLDMSKVSMTPPDAEFNSVGFDFMSWPAAEAALPDPSYPPEACPGSETAYDDLALPGGRGAPSTSLGFKIPAERNYAGWARAGSISNGPYPTPLDTSSTDFPYSYFAANGRVADSDSESYESPLSAISPVSSSEPIKKRHSVGGGDRYQTSESSIKADSPRPAKRTCSDASEHTAQQARSKASYKASYKTASCLSKIKSGAVSKSKFSGGGSSSSSSSSSVGSSKSKARKETHKTHSSAAHAARDGRGESHKIQLRTACRRPKAVASSSSAKSARPAAEQEDDLTPDERRARQSHNLVEKQYRSRLNQQFESLLAVLPADRHAQGRHGGHGHARGAGVGGVVARDDRRLSKAEVLEMARHRILALEEESESLQLERRDLLENAGIMRDVAARQAMGKVPV